MFADELGGNTNRRRQQEARDRRRKLKQEQEKKAQKEKQQQSTDASSSTDNTVPKKIPSPPVTDAVVTSTTKPVGSLALSSEGDAKPTAVTIALQQRQQRQQVQEQQKAATVMQAWVRAHRSNMALLKSESTLLLKRLQDLGKLSMMLKQKGNSGYVPPPATATALVRQILFLMTSFPYKRKSQAPQTIQIRDALHDTQKIQFITQLVLLPGGSSPDANANPFLVWIQDYTGRRRLERLLRLVLVATTLPNTQEAIMNSCIRFIKALLWNEDSASAVQKQVSSHCASLLFQSAPPALPDGFPTTNKRPSHLHVAMNSTIDMIAILRYHMLYGMGGTDPIPATAESARESCIPTSRRKQADILFLGLVGIIQRAPTSGKTVLRKQLQVRVVSELLTIPLLTWKLSVPTVDSLLKSSEKTGPSLLIEWLRTFTEQFREELSSGNIDETLCRDTSLISCPATSTQCLLGNLVQIGRNCTTLNGSSLKAMDFTSSCVFYNFIASLVDAIPLGTFSSRDSVVEWISDGTGHHSPVVLSKVVMDQCKTVLLDSYIRKLFHCAVDKKSLKIDDVLHHKNAKDLKHEKELLESGRSAMSLAATEAKIDRKKGFWKSSGWARKLTKGVTTILGPNDSSTVATKEKGSKLIDASSMSRKLAAGAKAPVVRKEEPRMTEKASDHDSRIGYTPELMMVLCRLYAIVLARWGGGGGEDIVKRFHPKNTGNSSQKKKDSFATTKQEASMRSVFDALCWSSPLIQATWTLIQSHQGVTKDVYSLIDPSKGSAPVRCHSIRPAFSQPQRNGVMLLFLFTALLRHALIVTDDTEIHDLDKPLPLHQLRRCIQTLKQLLYRATCIDDVAKDDSDNPSAYFGLALIYNSSKVMIDLYDRSSRRPLSLPKLWLVEDLLEKDIRRCKSENEYVELLSEPVLRVCPFLVSFKRRLKLFDRIITTNRNSIQGENSTNPFNSNPLKPGIPVRITRGRVLEDGLATMNNLGRNMRQRIAVQYFNEAGVRESGIDAGGLFKEFWTDLCSVAFDPNYALFRTTEENCMYPNPSSAAAHGSEHIVLFEFLGRILGKSLYEGITIQPKFAHFFLSFLRGEYNYLHMLPDLSTMDKQLYDNLIFLKTFDGDAADLCLSFTVTNDEFGGNREIPLMPKGGDIDVTNKNKQHYIGLVAKYYLVDRLKEQAEAMNRGLKEVIDQSWIRLFNEPELQVLISGPSDGKIDVDDMRSNCRYTGGFTGIDPTIKRFWSALASFDSKQQGELLRFVTSCERPPPLGFGSLNPPLTIQRVGIMRDGDKLPTSSTCFNVLKLPTYSSEKVMKERLLYAVQSGAGFELS